MGLPFTLCVCPDRSTGLTQSPAKGSRRVTAGRVLSALSLLTLRSIPAAEAATLQCRDRRGYPRALPVIVIGRLYDI